MQDLIREWNTLIAEYYASRENCLETEHDRDIWKRIREIEKTMRPQGWSFNHRPLNGLPYAHFVGYKI